MFRKLNALDIGNFNIKTACGNVMINKVNIEDATVIRTPDGMIDNGLILKPKELYVELKDEINKMKKYTKETAITVSSSAIVIRDIIVPKVPRRELTRMMRSEAEEHLPVSLDDHIFDFKIIDEISEKGGISSYKVMLVAIPINIVNSYVEFLEYSGLDCYSIDFAGNSLVKQIASEVPERGSKSQTTAIIDIGHKMTTVTITSNGKFQFFRIFDHGGMAMTDSVMNRIGVEREDAINLKKKYGIMPCDETGFAGECVDVSHAIKDVLKQLCDEINSYFDFYMSRDTGNIIDKIVLVGGGSLVKNVDEYIMKAFNIPVSKHTRVGNLKLEGEDGNEMGMYFASCLGALKS